MVLTGMLSQPYRPTTIGTIVAKETPKCIQVKVLHEALKNNPEDWRKSEEF